MFAQLKVPNHDICKASRERVYISTRLPRLFFKTKKKDGESRNAFIFLIGFSRRVKIKLLLVTHTSHNSMIDSVR